MIYHINLIPAYGRDYKTPEAALSAWNSGADFLIADIGSKWNNKYTSKRDWPDHAVRIRFNHHEQFIIVHDGKAVQW